MSKVRATGEERGARAAAGGRAGQPSDAGRESSVTEATPERTGGAGRGAAALVRCEGVTVSYGGRRALAPCDLSFAAGEVTALIGPSGCGKSTFLRCLDLMNREIPGCRVGGSIWYHGRDVNAPGGCDVYELRRSIGMVFQQPNPFAKSIYENVALAPRRHGLRDRDELDALVERSLREAALWDEVKDKLRASARALSGGQQQRLCIARALALRPDVILMDEPCSALDPIATRAIEQTVRAMAESGICVVIVTHNMQQARRVSDRTAFFYLGELVESGPTAQVFETPRERRTRAYLRGEFS